MKQNCIILYNSFGDFNVKPISVEKFNSKFQDIKGDSRVEYVLVPISKICEKYIAIPRIAIPDFKPCVFDYNLVIYELTQDFESLLHGAKRSPNSLLVNANMHTECTNIYELYVFVYSMVKFMAYNELQNICRFKPGRYNRRLVYQDRNYVFDITTLLKDGKTIVEDNNGLLQVMKAISNTYGKYPLITPDIFKFFINGDKKCSFTPYKKSTKIAGFVNKHEDHIRSYDCNHYSAYVFMTLRDRHFLECLTDGVALFIMYTPMKADEYLFQDGPMTVETLLEHPDYAVVHKVEEYNLYTITDYIETVAFAAEMLDMMNLISSMENDELKDSVCMIQIKTNVADSMSNFTYTVSKDMIDSGDIDDVVDDFMNQLIDQTIPF